MATQKWVAILLGETLMIEIGTKIVSLDPGSTIIVGLPGSGKTTLVKTIINQYKLNNEPKNTITIFAGNDNYLNFNASASALSDIETELKHLILPEIMRRYEWIKSGETLDEHGYIVIIIDSFDEYILNEDNNELAESVTNMIETIMKIGSNVKVNCILTAQSDKVFSYEMIHNVQNKIALGKTVESMFEQMFENLDLNGKLGEGYLDNATNTTNFNFFKNG